MTADDVPPRIPAAATHRAAEHWRQLKRASAQEAFRYTRFVTVMKHALPIMAVAILGVVMAYALYPRDKDRISLSYEQVAGIAGDLTMKKPRLSGTDAKGNPYLITADLAVQEGRNSRKVTLTNVDADLQFEDDRWANIKAGKGFVDLDARYIDLSRQINLYTDSGYTLQTDRAHADLDRNVISGQTRVTGQGPMGTFAADSFVLDRQRRHVTLQGHVTMKLFPKQVKR